jgi:dienelactone hydrolase
MYPHFCNVSSVRTRRRGLCGVLIAAALAALVACATDQPSGPADEEVLAFAARGYSGAERRVASTTTHAWSVSAQSLNVVVSLPDGATAAPLVIYLPGLGETSEAGELWRAAWSSAGYAVLSVQLLAADERAWMSPLARSGEFRKMGLDRFGAVATRQRLRMLAGVVAEGERRTAQGEATWARIDWKRVAIAGFDVGAYVTMIAAGEFLDGVDDRPPLPVRAAIALSPFANPAPGSGDSRYHDIRIPVLSVTSNADGDPLGLMDGAGARSVPFERMPGPDKYLLTLRDFSHARLGGGATAATPEPTAKRARSSDDDLRPRRCPGPRRDEEEPVLGRPRAVERAIVRSLSGNALRMRVLAAQAVSTAFLDASMKDDTRAKAWLGNEAPTWLGALGELARR